MCCIAQMRQAVTDSQQKIEILELINTNQRALKKYSDHAPMNFLHKYYLVQAELFQLEGNHLQ